MFFSFRTSVPHAIDIAGIPALQMFIAERREDTWSEVFRQVIESGYDLQNITVQGVSSEAYGVMISIKSHTEAYPMVLLYDVAGRIYVVMLERFDKAVAISYLQSKLIETAGLQELATISMSVHQMADRAELTVGYTADDSVDRRALITMVAEVASGYDVNIRLLSFSSTESRVVFTISGKQYQAAIDGIRHALKSGYRDMITEVAQAPETEDRTQARSILKRVVGRLFGEGGPVESAAVFNEARAAVGDRVVASTPEGYRTGTVEGIAQVRSGHRTIPRLQVRFDNGRDHVLAVASDGSGIAGFTTVKRRKLDALSEQAALQLLDRNRWVAAPLKTALAGESV